MQKEIIIVIIIVITIILVDTLTQKYTKDSFTKINSQLDEIKTIGKELEKDDKSSYSTRDTEETKERIKEKIKIMQNDWKKINKKTAFYIEHDELEKVETDFTACKSLTNSGEYGQAISELEKMAYVLEHITDKYSFNWVNIF